MEQKQQGGQSEDIAAKRTTRAQRIGHWLRQRVRQGIATFTGYAVWAGIALLLIFNLFNSCAAQLGISSGFSYGLPLRHSYGMSGSRLIVDEESTRNFNGDGATFQVWRLSGSPSELRKTVDREVWDSLVWFHRPFDDRDKKVFDFVCGWSEYAKAAPYANTVRSGDFYFAYEHLRIYDDGRVGDAGIWLFSPDKMLLVYLNANL